MAHDRHWRLLPSERVLWQGKPRLDVPRDRLWIYASTLCFALVAVLALFAGLLWVAEIPAVKSTALLAFYLLVTGVAVRQAPRYLFDPCEFMITDKQVIWRRGATRRTMLRGVMTYARIHWHRSVPGVGQLELVRAVPFGPLSRKQRLWLHDIEAPDRLLALIREVEPAEHAGYADVSLIDRLDRGERVQWGAGPAGLRIGAIEAVTAVMGVGVLVLAAMYLHRTGALLVGLEHVGLPVKSWTWLMLFSAIAISATIMVVVGVVMLWKGSFGAREEGTHTEYILTDTRLLIRRGLTELSIDRRRIVDVADVPSSNGSRNLYLILDGPDGRALEVNGALSVFSTPSRAQVPPVLYEVKDLEVLRGLLFPCRDSRPPRPKAA